MKQVQVLRTDPHMGAITMPENLRVGLMINRQREACSRIGCDARFYNFAFGQSPFPVPPPMVRALTSGAVRGEYTDAAGIPELREAISNFYGRHFAISTGPERVVVGNGTKELMFMLFSMLDATVIIPSPSWVGYAPILRLLGKSYVSLALERERGYRIDPRDLAALLAKNPDRRHLLVLNNPNNPTGALYSQRELEEIAEVCRTYGCLVLADEIYALTTYAFEHFVSMGVMYPEGTFVTGGLSKDRSAAGYRLGTCILPADAPDELLDDLTKVAATIRTSVAAPVQHAAVTAYSPSVEIEEYMRNIRSIHSIMCRYLSRATAMIKGVGATQPEGGFYFLADFNALRDRLESAGIAGADDLSAAMLAHPHHIATVGGEAIMLPQENLSLRIACVDYDGAAALEHYRSDPPRSSLDEVAFVNDAAPRMVDGITAIRRFVEGVKKR
ncbi:pyridoxal phosphate-dependent aminotransferase [Methanofollis fontis]|nr:pyridoxal phosphate-dependent aminotransferase [Methanofollis fontis]